MANVNSAKLQKVNEHIHIFMDCIITKQILDQFTDALRAFVDIDTTRKEMDFGSFLIYK